MNWSKWLAVACLVLLASCGTTEAEHHAEEIRRVRTCLDCKNDECAKINRCDAFLKKSNFKRELSRALYDGNLIAVRFYIEEIGVGVNEDLTEGEKRPAIISIATSLAPTSAAVAKYLIDRGADVNYESTGITKTPLLAAIWKGNNQVANLLIDQGADQRVLNDRGYDVCVHAHRYSNFEILPKLNGCCKRIASIPADTRVLLEEKLRPPAFHQYCEAVK